MTAETPAQVFARYHRKHGFTSADRISTPPPPHLGLVVVIPCHDEPQLIDSLESLAACEPPPGAVECIVVVNAGAHHSSEVHARNAQTAATFRQWKERRPASFIDFYLIELPDLPPKDAGVGLARKCGMDVAAHRLCAVQNPRGVIACFDADSLCTPNYLSALWQCFEIHPGIDACSIRFEHPLSGPGDAQVYEGIQRYELYLRYYRAALAWAGHPHAVHTIGSSMAVRASAYMEQGGMNRRKAGEDFYFLHKFTPLGTLGVLNETTVIPSPRASHRVPFGTGRAISGWLQQPQPGWPVFSMQTFHMLRDFFASAQKAFHSSGEEEWNDLHPLMQAFLQQRQFAKTLAEVRRHTTTETAFHKRFYRAFDALLALQFCHFARDKGLSPQPLMEAAAELAATIQPAFSFPQNLREALHCYRHADAGRGIPVFEPVK